MTDNPVDLAREVLDSVAYAESRFMSISDMPSIGRSAPALAHAVLSLTAEVDAYREETTRLREQVVRVRALADELDREASEHMDRPAYSRSGTRIRAALNGDNT